MLARIFIVLFGVCFAANQAVADYFVAPPSCAADSQEYSDYSASPPDDPPTVSIAQSDLANLLTALASLAPSSAECHPAPPESCNSPIFAVINHAPSCACPSPDDKPPSRHCAPPPVRINHKPDVKITLPLPAEIPLGKVYSCQKFALKPKVLNCDCDKRQPPAERVIYVKRVRKPPCAPTRKVKYEYY